MWALVLVGVCTVLLSLVFKLIAVRAKYASIDNQYPGPKNYPLVGSALQLGTDPVEIFHKLTGLYKKHGSIFTLWIGLRPQLVISDPALLSFVLSSITHIEKNKNYEFLKPWLGTGLLIAGGEKWKKRRKIITPAYHFKILEDFHTVMNSSSDILITKLSEATKMDQVDVYPYVTLHALDVICETAMGSKIHAQKKSDSEYVKAVKEAARVTIRRSVSAWKQYDFLFKFSDDYKIYQKSLKVLHGFTNSIIAKRRDQLLKDMNTGKHEENDDVGIKKRFAFLDLLLKSTMDGQPLSDEDIREEVDTFMFEGHDTTASGISFLLYNIANHPHVQEKLIEEIQSFVGDDLKRSLTFNELNQMQYIDMVIKETLRIYPSVPQYGRELKENVNYNGTILPKGLILTIFSYGVHHDPNIYPDPDKFDPERFSAENIKQRSLYSYIPFSAGQRNCIGQKFAMLEMKTTVCKILQHYKLSTAGPGYEVVLGSELVMKPAYGSFVKLTKRS